MQCGGEFFYFYLIGVNDDTVLQRRVEVKREIQARCPLLGFTVENCTNSIITYTHTDYLKYNLTKLFHLCGNMYTGTQNVENVQAVISHCEKGGKIIDKGNICTAA